MRIMDCVLLLFNRKIDPVTPDPEKPCCKPSWGESLKLMSGGGFLNNLLTFAKVKREYCITFKTFSILRKDICTPGSAITLSVGKRCQHPNICKKKYYNEPSDNDALYHPCRMFTTQRLRRKG